VISQPPDSKNTPKGGNLHKTARNPHIQLSTAGNSHTETTVEMGMERAVQVNTRENNHK